MKAYKLFLFFVTFGEMTIRLKRMPREGDTGRIKINRTKNYIK